MGTIGIDQNKIVPNSDGSYSRRDVLLAFGSSYNNTGNDSTTGETLTAESVNLNSILGVEIDEDAGYGFEALGIDPVDPKKVCRIKVYKGAGGTTSSDSAGTPSGSVSAPNFTATGSKLTNLYYPDVKGSTRQMNPTLDGAEVTNANYISDYVAVAAGSWTMGPILNQPDVCRNIVVSIKNDSGGPLDLFQGFTSFNITGTDAYGNAVITNVPFNSNAGNKTIANGQFRANGSAYCLKTITSITIQNPPADGLKISVGLGGAIHCIDQLKNLSSADVIRTTHNGTVISPVFIYPNVYQSVVTFPDLTDGDDIQLMYRSLSGSTGDNDAPNFTGGAMAGHTHTLAGAPNAEVPNGTNLSTALAAVKATIYGY